MSAGKNVSWVFPLLTVLICGVGIVNNGGSKFVRVFAEEGCTSTYVDAGHPQVNRTYCCHNGYGDIDAATRRRYRMRFFLYVAIVLVRTFVLYQGLNMIEGFLQGDESKDCWYAQRRRSGRCSEKFDFSDHVVLAIVQYLSIQAFEMYAAERELSHRNGNTTLAGVLASTASKSVSVWLSVVSLGLLYDTSCFFHTPGETVFAMALSVIALWVPSKLIVLGGAGGGGEERGRGGDPRVGGGRGGGEDGGLLGPSSFT